MPSHHFLGHKAWQLLEQCHCRTTPAAQRYGAPRAGLLRIHSFCSSWQHRQKDRGPDILFLGSIGDKAKARLAATEKKFEAVRRWSPIVQQQFREASVRLVHFQERLDSDLPKGLARLERMVRSLDSYREVSSPVGGSSPEGGATGPRVTRSLDEAPAAQTPVTPETIAVPPQSPAPPVT